MRTLAQSIFIIMIATAPTDAADPILPNHRLTPGAVSTTDTTRMCQPGYSRAVRHTSGKLKHQIYVEYGVNKKAGNYEIDHLIPLSIGGADTRENLWPESHDTKPWNAGMKDRLENYLHNEVCAGRIAVKEAQMAIASDWIATYQKYLGEP